MVVIGVGSVKDDFVYFVNGDLRRLAIVKLFFYILGGEATSETFEYDIFQFFWFGLKV